MNPSTRSRSRLVAHRFQFEFVTPRCHSHATRSAPRPRLVLHRAPATHTSLPPPTPDRSETVCPDCSRPHTPHCLAPGMKILVLRLTVGAAYRGHRLLLSKCVPCRQFQSKHFRAV